MAENKEILELSARVCAAALAGGFAGCGAAPRSSFAGVPERVDPERVLAGYSAVLVLAAPPDLVTSSGPYGPALLDVGLSEALTSVRALLDAAGYQARPVVSGAVSLPCAAAAAGLGEVSPVGALVASGYGLSLTLVGMVTDAPLAPVAGLAGESPASAGESPASAGSGSVGSVVGPVGVCRDCGRCTQDCPAMLPGSFDLAWCTGCGVCLSVCPLGLE
ncbi:MAG: 4Fe-4S binding protein [Actinobacteria bacterium]|nr:4Fe-4S binding protein [Actinomycetota bacterium]